MKQSYSQTQFTIGPDNPEVGAVVDFLNNTQGAPHVQLTNEVGTRWLELVTEKHVKSTLGMGELMLRDVVAQLFIPEGDDELALYPGIVSGLYRGPGQISPVTFKFGFEENYDDLYWGYR